MHEPTSEILVFMGCAVVGYCLATGVARAGIVFMVGICIYAVIVKVMGQPEDAITIILQAVSEVMRAGVSIAVDLVGVHGVIGIVIGIMLRFYRVRIDHERRRGIVRFPIYPTPE